jgi:hypothetical protein
MEKRDFKAETRGEGAVTEQKKLPASAASHSISIELYASKIWAWVSWAYMGLRCGMSLKSRHASPPRRPIETRCHVFQFETPYLPRPLPVCFLAFLILTSHLPWHIKQVSIALYLRSCNLNAISASDQVIK